ncbi:2TM domain-containing protein [Flavobacteriaceae bacterium F89]|uniref:2TM domain-containing protein n=1 Tax=Cerina litoralis TaxID=2874477 RepID=A0AAE3EYF3_9FLAO|nr:2TM domain-containing protein [Cerina litoralis]MCG2462459.1 2TM domain-containing protein [Cerina litoralis]
MTKNLGKILITGLAIGIIIAILFIVTRFITNGSLQLDGSFFINLSYCLLFGVVLTVINGWYFDYVYRRMDWGMYSKYKLGIGALGGLVITMLAIFVIRAVVEMMMRGENIKSFVATENLSYYGVALVITIGASVVFHAIYFYRTWQENRVKEQKIIAGTASAKFNALKNQLDPHFLFNSLNVLTSLIEEDPEQAQKFTTSLSKVYRYVLEQKDKDLVTVDEELQFAKTYVRLLKMRFEDSIVLDILEKGSNPEARIVPLSLQLLLENAVKHNVVSSERPLHIKVYEDSGMLVVSNNLQEKQVMKRGSGVGLGNIRQRYDILTDRKVIIEQTSTYFMVRLPLLTKYISTVKTQQTAITDKLYERAKKRVEAIKGFYGNLTSYCIVIPILIYINYSTTSFPWAIFPALGWGFGVLMHGMEAYGYNPVFGKGWEQRKIKEFMDDERF